MLRIDEASHSPLVLDECFHAELCLILHAHCSSRERTQIAGSFMVCRSQVVSLNMLSCPKRRIHGSLRFIILPNIQNTAVVEQRSGGLGRWPSCWTSPLCLAFRRVSTQPSWLFVPTWTHWPRGPRMPRPALLPIPSRALPPSQQALLVNVCALGDVLVMYRGCDRKHVTVAHLGC